MRRVRSLILFRLPLLVAIAASAVLLIEYLHAGDPAFCSVGSGCMKVRMSPYSRLGQVPLPVFGLGGFALVYMCALFAKTKAHHALLAGVATLAASAAAILIVLQAVAVHAFCVWCVTVDVSAIVAAALGIMVWWQADADPNAEAEFAATTNDNATTGVWTLIGMLAVGLPSLWARYPVVPPLPPALAPFIVPGKINVISFTDFQCPFCRKLHPTIAVLREEHADDMHFVRLMMPLPSHGGATPAALAYLCVPEAQRDAMAERLYEAPAGKLSTETAEMAVSLGVDREAFETCVADPKTRATLDEQAELFHRVDGSGLPLTYVGDRVITGFNPDRLETAVAGALEPRKIELAVSWMWAALAVAFAAASAFTFRRRAQRIDSSSPKGDPS